MKNPPNTLKEIRACDDSVYLYTLADSCTDPILRDMYIRRAKQIDRQDDYLANGEYS